MDDEELRRYDELLQAETGNAMKDITRRSRFLDTCAWLVVLVAMLVALFVVVIVMAA